MIKVCFTYNNNDYVIADAQQQNEVASILGVKKTYLAKMRAIAANNCKNPSKSMLNYIKSINFHIIPFTEEEEKLYREEALEKKRKIALEQQEKKRLEPDYTEQRRGKDVKPRKPKQVKEKKVKPPKVVKPKRIKKEPIKSKKRQKSINSATLKEMINRANGKNTEELQLAYYSVAKRLSNKFWNRDFIEDMIMDAVLTCGKYFIKNVNVEKNVFAYLTELCKRSFAATFNLLNVKDKIGTNEINLIKFII